MTTAKEFISRQLGTTGWAPLNHGMAIDLCPDMSSAHYDFAAMSRTPALLPKMFKAQLYQAHVEGHGNVLVLARSAQFLPERIGWLGFFASGVKEVEVSPPSPQPTTPVEKIDTESRAAKLRTLAEQDPPAHDCHLRREILGAREELARE